MKRGDPGPDGKVFLRMQRGKPYFVSPDLLEKVVRRTRKAVADIRRKDPEANRAYAAKWACENRAWVRERARRYYRKYADKLRTAATEYYAKNKDRIRDSIRRNRLVNLEEARAEGRRYYRANAKRIIEQTVTTNRRKRQEDPVFRAIHNMRTRLSIFLRGHGNPFSRSLGCSRMELRGHLEKKFLPGMTWDNYGQWHIDHIVPLSSAGTADEARRLAHYSNLQPLWAVDNIRKGAKILS